MIISKILIKEIEEKVKSDIKTEMKTLKNLRLNKFKLKSPQNSQDHFIKKPLKI